MLLCSFCCCPSLSLPLALFLARLWDSISSFSWINTSPTRWLLRLGLSEPRRQLWTTRLLLLLLRLANLLSLTHQHPFQRPVARTTGELGALAACLPRAGGLRRRRRRKKDADLVCRRPRGSPPNEGPTSPRLAALLRRRTRVRAGPQRIRPTLSDRKSVV